MAEGEESVFEGVAIRSSVLSVCIDESMTARRLFCA